MFKDKNMGSKRPLDLSNTVDVFLMEAFNGTVYSIDPAKEFIIGRAMTCNVIIENLFMSRRQCTITYEDGNFIFNNMGTSLVASINCQPKRNNYPVILQHGDLLSFSNNETKTSVYKFCLLPKPDKKPKFNDLATEEINDQTSVESANKKNDAIVQTLPKLYVECLELRVDNLVIKSEFKAFMDGILKSMIMIENSTAEVFKKNKEQKATIEDLSKKVSEHNDALKKLEERKTVPQESSSLDMFKIQVTDLIENDCQCPICSETIYKARTSNCNHTFCEVCINKWLTLKTFCPVCRTTITSTHHSLIMDNFVTSLCDLLGGHLKSLRDELIKERSLRPIQTAIRGRKLQYARRGRPRQGRTPRANVLTYDLNTAFNIVTARVPLIDVVDLTTASTSSTP